MGSRLLRQVHVDCMGCHVHGPTLPDPRQACLDILERLGLADLQPMVVAQHLHGSHEKFLSLKLHPDQVQQWAPGLDTLGLAATLQIDTVGSRQDLAREIVVAMLMGPVAFEFPSVDELVSAVHIRINIVQAARKTMLAFHTMQAERPQDCWQYDEDRGFVLRPEASLTTALIKATQPEVSGELYSFSCYRASEYLILLGIAQELERCNPALYAQLQSMWTTNPIKSGLFHDVFLHEQGSMDAPLPPHYFVPGDRTWFRNPDEASADASGFEGSWVMYLGGGLFNNFWQRDKPYTMVAKYLEIYHWRNAVYRDDTGEERIDEDRVARLVQETLKDPAEMVRIVAVMGRYREPRGVYTDAGGCIDTTREFARWVRPGTTDLVLPLP
ncbi:MAG: hypothetical protein Q7T10_10650 [Rhodoferax sp.]|uniref:hypothetical protein n=1 Tax=Rhodoferax sp. TaxID=50421 RepID=UPI00271FC7BA|nr:hypothetical protein [Rhodoferax sp.]MDO8449250.1 hypothetical protein [Rhodoferax sp.]